MENYLDAFLTSRRTSRSRPLHSRSVAARVPAARYEIRPRRATDNYLFWARAWRSVIIGRWRRLAVFSRRLLRRLPWPKQPALRTCFCRTATRRAALRVLQPLRSLGQLSMHSHKLFETE